MKRGTVLGMMKIGVWICAVLVTVTAMAQQSETSSGALDGARRQDGYLPLFYQPDTGKVLLAVTRLEQPLLYQTALVSGVGSNDVGLDRGQLGATRVVRFRRAGPKVLLVQGNLDYRADSDDAQEVRAVREAFARSVLAGLTVVAEYEGAPVVDLTPLLFADSHGIAQRLASLEQGNFSLDSSASAVFEEQLLNFPQNTIVQAVLTFQGTQPGEWVSAVTPTPERLSVTYLHQFAQLPEPGFTPRPYHPRAGYFDVRYRDYAAPLGSPLDKRFLVRHRLQWRDGTPGPDDGVAVQEPRPVAEPIIYYLDPGTPEPARSALLEGASWWRDAFTAAGFADAFRVEMLPADAHPLDLRYNVIQWVHRATRGWSYGASVVDPRTGEIIKGHVTLGSSRVRQDMLIAEALTAPFVDGQATGEDRVAVAAREMALARLRQLAAHEVGHTLGLIHNFAASSVGDRSVMDYPHPNLYLTDAGQVGLDRAYQRGVSDWDRWAIRYGYQPFTADQEHEGLRRLRDEATAQNLLFISDSDARVDGSPYPRAHLWDNGEDPVQRLHELIAIRDVGLAGFSEQVIAPDTPLYQMEQRLVPVFLLHRFQVQAVGKLLGGVNYDHRLRGDTFVGVQTVAREAQNAALSALMTTLDTDFLRLPERLLGQFVPPAEGYRRSREYFTHPTAPTFDHLAPARAAIALSLTELLHPVRSARINDQRIMDESLPGYDWVLQRLAARLRQRAEDDYGRAINDELRWQFVQQAAALAVDPAATVQVRAQVVATLDGLRAHWAGMAGAGVPALLNRYLERFFKQLELPAADQPQPTVPPGSPIGG